MFTVRSDKTRNRDGCFICDVINRYWGSADGVIDVLDITGKPCVNVIVSPTGKTPFPINLELYDRNIQSGVKWRKDIECAIDNYGLQQLVDRS